MRLGGGKKGRTQSKSCDASHRHRPVASPADPCCSSEEEMLSLRRAALADCYCHLSCLSQEMIQRQGSSAMVLAGGRMNMNENASK